MWYLIVSVPDHCLSYYFVVFLCLLTIKKIVYYNVTGLMNHLI